mmetsp:Transcript_23482/g.59372  ORF Transcript_23482/g.59372 Transcript_23482/m.59372 type:complete len:355 (+) Transcript_23482:7602-8666(+)
MPCRQVRQPRQHELARLRRRELHRLEALHVRRRLVVRQVGGLQEDVRRHVEQVLLPEREFGRFYVRILRQREARLQHGLLRRHPSVLLVQTLLPARPQRVLPHAVLIQLVLRAHPEQLRVLAALPLLLHVVRVHLVQLVPLQISEFDFLLLLLFAVWPHVLRGVEHAIRDQVEAAAVAEQRHRDVLVPDHDEEDADVETAVLLAHAVAQVEDRLAVLLGDRVDGLHFLRHVRIHNVADRGAHQSREHVELRLRDVGVFTHGSRQCVRVVLHLRGPLHELGIEIHEVRVRHRHQILVQKAEAGDGARSRLEGRGLEHGEVVHDDDAVAEEDGGLERVEDEVVGHFVRCDLFDHLW